MTLTLNAEPLAEIAEVRLTATSSNADIVRIYRIDKTGRYDLRTHQGALPAREITLIDYECPLNETVRYFAQAPGEQVSVATVKLSNRKSIISVPFNPALTLYIDDILNDDHTREMPGAVDLVLGRPDPLVTLMPLGLRTGQLTFQHKDYAKLKQLLDVASRGLPLLLRQPAHSGLDMYFTVTSGKLSAQTMPGLVLWTMTLDFVEQTRPGGYIIPKTWDWRALTARHLDFVDLEASYENYLAVMEDDPIG